MRVRLLLLAALALPFTGCSLSPGCDTSDATCTRILFIGNSYTSVNDLPALLASLAASAGRHVDAAMLSSNGATLADHVAAPDTAATISSRRWSVVVLQEQSQIPALSSTRQSEMEPAAATLVRVARSAGAMPLLLATWGHEAGWPGAGLPTYASMQAALDDGYRIVAAELGVRVAPVGSAWEGLVQLEPQIALWQVDGVHPTPAGSYVAACVLYATVFGRSPEGLAFHAGLPDRDATAIQTIAREVVLDSR